MNPVELALLGGLSAARGEQSTKVLLGQLTRAGVQPDQARATLRGLQDAGLVAGRRSLRMTPAGVRHFLNLHARVEAALAGPDDLDQTCPSVPWLTLVRTCWIDAVSVNYAVDPEALASLLPAPLEPEIFKGSAWVQVLMSSLQDMRPQGMPSLFGVCFYQVSFRAAVQVRTADGQLRRGGYFVRADTNHPVMRAVGLALNEFRFHHFGECDMTMLRQGHQLTVGSDPQPGSEGGKLVGIFDTRPLQGPSEGSVWASLEELHEPLVECYDAFGVDPEGGWLYTLTIDRDPWNARFIDPGRWYCEYFDTGPLGGARLDSVLFIPRCPYRWTPLRRTALSVLGG